MRCLVGRWGATAAARGGLLVSGGDKKRRRRPDDDSPTDAAGGIRLEYVASNHLLHSYHCAGLRMDYQGSDLKDFIQTNGHHVLQRVENNYTLRRFTENEIRCITNGYKTMLGEGAFGQVYKGTLDDQSTVAVKRYKHETHKEEFAREVIVHSQINHRNVVRLLGCCIEENDLMIVMEFISNWNLDSILHCSSTDVCVPFPLDKRLDIAIQVAEALWCMHSMYSPVLHGDIKPANILLNESLVPKVSDFGIARLLCADGAQHTKNIIGSIGYLDPAFCETGILTPKSDVYSFGVVLLELITRQKAVNGTVVLAQSFTEAHKKGKNLMFDKEIRSTETMKFLGQIGKLAAKCLRRDARVRPEMVEVVISLRLIREAMQGEEGNLIQHSRKEVESASCQFVNLNIFTKEEMKKMTKNYSMAFREEFRERLYSGVLPNGHSVIASQLRTRSEKDREIFLKTMRILSQKNHKNIMNVVGFYLGESISDCVYESYWDLPQSNDGSIPLSNRNLYGTICSRDKIPLYVRLSIAVQCAEGLVHIHSLVAENPEPHDSRLYGNFRSTNIFLDKNFVPKVFNPNLSSLLGLSVIQRYTFFAFNFDRVSEKYYSDPRGVSDQLFDSKSDVYSFGVVLLELITWTTVRYMSDGRAQVLNNDFLNAYRENPNAINIFGEKVHFFEPCGNKFYEEQFRFFVHEAMAIAVECLQLDHEERPEMSVVLSRLRSIRSELAALPTTLDELKERTLNFSDNVRIGKSSAVFLGVDKNGQKSAVKKFSPSNSIVEKVPTIPGMCKHDNVVQLLGFFVDGETHVLAYEYAPRGSLYDILHGKNDVMGEQPGLPLSWLQRVKIAISAAKGLEFLHNKAIPRVIHTNIKSSNILLFDNDVAKIGDLGISVKPVPPLPWWEDCRDTFLTGYGAPEWAGDVFSFGVVLLELLTGRKAFDHTLPLGQRSLVTWATPRLSEDKVKQCIDPRLGAYPRKGAAKMAAIAALCVQYKPNFRPDMSNVVEALSPLLHSAE
ncbi:hypothetical protein ACP4OV_016500 [Aristida adscensionis]